MITNKVQQALRQLLQAPSSSAIVSDSIQTQASTLASSNQFPVLSVASTPGNGSREPETLQPYLDLLVDELLELCIKSVFDAYTKTPFLFKCEVSSHVLDYPGVGFVSDKVQTLLNTLTEISSILYAKPEERCPRSILRLHNQTFICAIACEEVIRQSQILTEKKFYGRRGHDISAEDSPHCDRILNSDNQEDEEDEEIVGVQQVGEDLMESA
ncbi:hypothetical protein ACROYT_G014652 [Oculina patagonica]